jgi:hypothetical protein
VLGLLGSVAYVVLLSWAARRFSDRPGGVILLGLALLLFIWAAARPPFVTALRSHPDLARFGAWQKDDHIGEAYIIVVGLVLVAFGLYKLLAATTP